MSRFGVVSIVAVGVLVLGLASVAVGSKQLARPLDPPDYAVGRLDGYGPFVILQQGDTTWVTPYADTTACPGDPFEGHGGEATGGPDGSETWCFENGISDTCGTVSPWDTHCFDHVDVRSLPSETGINFWHLDTYRADDLPYPPTNEYCLWCGTDSLWEGNPVECGTWQKTPGYGNQWNCVVQLDLSSFSTANGCTLYFDTRYDTECNYDYFYVEVFDGSEWQTLATFNSASNTGVGICGQYNQPTADYFGNTDAGQPNSADWQTRSDPSEPVYKRVIPADTSGTSDPKFRWRFTSDGAWSDKDGRGDTDGAAFIDNVWVYGDAGNSYVEDFEHGSWATLASRGWSKPGPDGVLQGWHTMHDPDRPYEGGDGGEQTTCTLDSSIVWRARPDQGYTSGFTWRNGWYYRLLSPVVPIQNTGCVVHFDEYICALEYTCDYVDTRVRFHTTNYGWCPWNNIDGFITYGGCFFWNFDLEEDVTPFYGPSADSMQFGWDMMDVSNDNDFCQGKHKWSDHIVDNVSIGFFDGNATIFSARSIDILQDTFENNLCAFSSEFDAYDADTLLKYSGPPYDDVPLYWNYQLKVDVTDKDDIGEVRLYASIDEGATWQFNTMDLHEAFDPQNPLGGGLYNGTVCPDDFSLTTWDVGTEVWYYVRCEDGLNNLDYFPGDADPTDPDHTGGREDYFTFSILPMFPDTYEGVKVLLVDGYGRSNYDYAECFEADDEIVPLEDIYEETLRDAGYCYDKFDISGAGSNVHIHPLNYDQYDAVVWFTGPYFSNYLFDKEAQLAIRDYLGAGGKVVMIGDRIAYSMDPDGANEDSLGGEFLSGIMGCDYQAEMESGFTKPYVYLEAVSSVSVFGTPVAVDLDSLLVYRECPYLKDMSYVVTNASPPTGYTAQPLLEVLDPPIAYDPADGAIYVEYQDVGQCVFINYDFCGWMTHMATECDGNVPTGRPGFTPGYYYGRVDLMRVILEDIMGLPSQGTGAGGTSDVDPKKNTFQWALHQNSPNPAASGTEIRFEVARTSDVSIKVFNAMGQLVKTLENERMQPGKYSLHWDGTNRAGEKVSSGVYFYKMEAGQFGATKKMLVVK
jgi:hypothetical protein